MSLARARALAIVGILVVAALVLVVAAVVKDKQSSASYANGGCGPGKVKVSVKLPPPGKIKLNIFNGTGELVPNPKAKEKGQPATIIVGAVANLGGQVAEDFRNRGFIVGKVEEHPEKFAGTAKLHYGLKAFAAATVVRAYFLGEEEQGGLDTKRSDDVIDVTLGAGFKELGSKTEVNQKIAQLGNPSPPPGTCDSGT
ncbi:MAG: hypothetical protein AUI14_02630 [Actinobacteria bacterium 13_2_20CM_2_71_6]|nr:MAG: hypothetical protein AUI14_02630 [Actinobacteria bacterium 13_2_20CM_2_71_6]